MSRSHWGVTPRQSIDAACKAYGREVVVHTCLDLLAGRDVDPALVKVLGGPRADRLIDAPSQAYWLRVLATRGLLWAWDDCAAPALTGALADESWRVREMAAKVVARHLVDAALPQVVVLGRDPVPRVRSAAARAVHRLTQAGT